MSRKRLKKKPIKKISIVTRRKLVGLFMVVLLALVGLALRITMINASDGKKYERQVLTQSQQQYSSQVLPFKRGDIYDRNGTVLATSNKVYNVILDCKIVNSDEKYVEPTVKALVDILGIEEETIRDYLTSEDTRSSQYQIILNDLTMDQKKEFDAYTTVAEDSNLSKAQIEERRNVKGIWFEEDYLRTYPLGALACDTIGFTVDGNISDWGIEGYYSSTLNGVDGRTYGSLSDESTVQQNLIQPTNGKNVVSTIDVGAQQIVEKYVQEFMKTMGAKNVGVIVMNPNNGEVLAMATKDSYDLNDPRDLSGSYSAEAIAAMNDEETAQALSDMWNNFCVTDTYEPGSVVKPIVMASALECGALSENDHFVCDGGQTFGPTTIKCTGSHGDEALRNIIANSCNDGMMQIAAKTGAEQFVENQSMMNFGTRTGIDLPNEGTGIIHTLDSMGVTELACSAFGQGYNCTMIQEIAAMASVINGGKYYQPHLVKQIMNSDGSVSKTINPTLLKQTISSGISTKIRSYMQASVVEGTSKYSKVQGYSSGGKTGTAEKYPRDNGKYLVSFIGFAPVDNPELLIYVVADEVKADRQDNSAYPQYISQGIMSELLPYMNVTPDEVEEGGEVPTTELWENFKNVASNMDVDESLLGETTDREGTQEGAEGTVEGSFEGTDDPNIPAPLEEEETELENNDEYSEGLTNEEMDIVE